MLWIVLGIHGMLSSAFASTPTNTNASSISASLKDHPSPYLALHADDPVTWRELDAAAMDAARVDDRLLFLSIGYFACHWCHVMQRESFRNAEIAEKLNQRFVPVKIDRELDPALDKRMAEFAEQLLGQAGWPLNVFVTPDGHPVFAVLYTPPGQFALVLDQMHELWRSKREQVSSAAGRVAIRDLPPAKEQIDSDEAAELARLFIDQALLLHDDFQGGFGTVSKFPQASALDYLVDLLDTDVAPLLRPMVELTLDVMAAEGLYDHVGGGFFRYVVDPGWNTPHFEKMLYDNAMLARVYLRAAPHFPERDYLRIARATLDFMRRELHSPAGAMIASLSAVDGDDVEGGYYLYSDAELESLLDPSSLRVVRAHCDASGSPVFSAGHHLRCSRSLRSVARNLGIDENDAKALFETARLSLLEARQQRELPADRKLLAGWNGLALSAFSEAATMLGDRDYTGTARAIRDYLVNQLWIEGELFRARSGNAVLGRASIEDYAFVARGLWDYAEAIGDNTDRALARDIVVAAFKLFRDGNGWQMARDELLAPQAARELISDSPMPSPAAVLAQLSLEIARHDDDPRMRRFAHDALNRATEALAANAFFHATHIRALQSLAGLADTP